jgi:hypothetical protein
MAQRSRMTGIVSKKLSSGFGESRCMDEGPLLGHKQTLPGAFDTVQSACGGGLGAWAPSRHRGKGCCKFNTTGKLLRLYGNVPSLKIKNNSLYRNSDLRYWFACLAPTEGRFAIVTIRRARDAMDAVASGDLSPDENACSGRRSRVVLAPRPWRQSTPPVRGWQR